MTGIPKKVLRSFDKSAEEFSDVVLEVGGKKFYVLKKFLASHSTYFNALLLGKPEMSEVTIQDTSSVDFQNLLEVLYGEPAIDEDTIDGILTLAHKFTMPLPIQKCEEFLIEKSEKSVKEKLKLVKKYQLKSLKTHCLSKINTPYGINALMPFDHNDMDPEVVMALLKKSLATDEFYLDCIMRFTGPPCRRYLPIQKCEEFLIEKSEKSIKEKLKLVKKYQLKSLKKYCLSKINTIDGIKALLPFGLNDMDPEVVMALFNKELATDKFYFGCFERFLVVALIFLIILSVGC